MIFQHPTQPDFRSYLAGQHEMLGLSDSSLTTDLVNVLDSVDVCSLVVLAAALNFVGEWACQPQPHLRQRGVSVGVAAFVLLLAVGLIADGGTDDAVMRLMQAGVVAACVAGAATIALPAVGWLYDTSIEKPTAQFRSVLRSWDDQRMQGQRQAQEQREREEWERSRPQREQAQREAAERQRREQEQKASDQRRREAARFQVRLLYDRHAGKIKASFPRKRFDEYVTEYLSDAYPADEVEKRAEELRNMILDFFESTDDDRPQRSLTEIRTDFAGERQLIEASDLDEDTKAAMLADLNLAEDKAIRDVRQR